MNPSQRQVHQASGATPSTYPPTVVGHPSHTQGPVVEIRYTNPLQTLRNLPKVRISGHFQSSHQNPVRVTVSCPYPSGSTSTWSYATATSSTALPVRMPSTRTPAIQAFSTPQSSTQPPSIPLLRGDPRSVPSKRALDYAPGPAVSCHAPPACPPRDPLLPSQLHSPQPPWERPAKRRRLDAGCSDAEIGRGGLQRPSSLSQSCGVDIGPSVPKPEPLDSPPIHASRPMRSVVPQPPFRRLSLRQNRVPLPPRPKVLDPHRLSEDALREPVYPAVVKKLGELIWKQQKRVWGEQGGYSDPLLALPVCASLSNTESSSSCGAENPAQSPEEGIALYGPPPRTNELIHLGESLPNSNTTKVDGDEDGGFGEALDTYCVAVQGSTLSMELELAVGGYAEVPGVGWEATSSLEVGVEHKPSTSRSSEEPQGSRTCTLAEYGRLIKAEGTVPPPESAIPSGEPPLGIEWSYSCRGYTTGNAVDVHKANVTANALANNRKGGYDHGRLGGLTTRPHSIRPSSSDHSRICNTRGDTFSLAVNIAGRQFTGYSR